MLILAHRGFHRAAPENSLNAFQAAADLGIDAIETDVRVTRDGMPVLIHDRLIPDGRPVGQVTRQELMSALGYPVPLLSEALERFPGIFWNIEIKSHQGLPAVLEVLERFRDTRRLLVTSFRHDLVLRCAQTMDVKCGLIVAHRPADPESLLREVPQHDRIMIMVWDYNVIDESLVQITKEKGFYCLTYGPATTEEFSHCMHMGMDGVITDYPDRVRKQ